jgi:lipoprotein signal peptidase
MKQLRTSARTVKPASLMLAILVVVVLLDQTSKWWAWQHVGGAMINNGGDELVGPVIGQWYTEALPGGLLDLLDAGLVMLAIALLLRRPRPTIVLVSGTLMISGWCSNLLDRLGLHYLTAPGSARGAVDFVSIGSMVFNLADFVIMGATPLFLLVASMSFLRVRVTMPDPAGAEPALTSKRHRPVARLSALAAAVSLVALVGIGATDARGMTSPEQLAGTGAVSVAP